MAEICRGGTLKRPFAVVVVLLNIAEWVEERRRLVGDDGCRFG